MKLTHLLLMLSFAGAVSVCQTASADQAAIMKAWSEHNAAAPAIKSIVKTPIPGLYEVRAGGDIAYVDESGEHMILVSKDQPDGHIFDLQSHVDLTDLRIAQQIKSELPGLRYADAVVFKQGTGAKHLVVFEDPNCHYCKDFEKSLVQLKDVTIYTFLIPILGPDSVVKAHDIWCSGQSASAWRSWMLAGQVPSRAAAACDDAALTRNVKLSRQLGVRGTPNVILEDGSRIAGAMPLDKLKQRIDGAS